MQDPAKYLNKLGLKLPGWIDSTRTAVLDSSHASYINYEAFFFADRDNKSGFDANMLAYIQRLTDPVSLTQFKPGVDAPHMMYQGRHYFFSADSTYQQFRRSPELYALPLSP